MSVSLSPLLATAPAAPERRRRGRGYALAAAAGLLAAAAAQLPAAALPGQTDDGNTIARVVVQSSITLTGLTPEFVLTGLPGDTVDGPDAVSYTVTTNNQAGYTVGVQAASATLNPAETANTDRIPIANLQVRADDAGAYESLSNTAAVTLRTKTARSAETGDQYSDDYRVDIPFVASDTYSATLNYVATTL